MSSNMETQRRLMGKYKISFGGPIDSIRNPQWPSSHDTIFQNIRELGKTDFREFRDSINADSHRHPWRKNVQRRAERIAQEATLCLDGRKNELGWRLSLEHAILGRFSVEVACRNCRGRLWRSEVEVVSNNLNDKDAMNSLQSRQQRRQPCACDKSKYIDDFLDHGINPLFDSRVDEAMVYSPALQADLPKREERPDRVYGLHPTSRIQRLLEAIEGNFSSAGDSPDQDLRSNLFKPDNGVPIHFPFLILEAKSEKSASPFSDIQVQTAFGIRELLSLQDRLAQVAGEDDTWDAGPLVWFLSYKGEQWKVHAAFIERKGTTKFYRTVQLWNGGINSPEHALQLLLIIDYIVDWARDLYREGIAQSLQRISGDDSATLAGDTDIFSLSEKVQNWAFPDDNEETIEDSLCPSGDPLRVFDSLAGAFRDARFIQTKFIGLYIIKDNFNHLINCTRSREASKRLAISVLDCLKDSCRLRRDMLDELEICWTNKSREGLDMTPPSEIFIVAITALWYFTPDWEQTRELSYLAVSESLLDDLIQVSGIDRSVQRELSHIPFINSMPSFQDLLKRPATDNLSACASRACIYTTNSSNTGSSSTSSFVWRSLPTERSTSRGSRWRHREVVIRAGPRSKARELVYDLYLKHRIGRCEPTSPIFRLSAKLDELAPAEKLRQDTLAEDVWPWTNSFPSLKYNSLVFAISEHHQQVPRKPDLCIFVMDPSILGSGLSTGELLYGPSWHLKVKRFDRKPGWNRGWNLKNVESNDKRIMAKLRNLVENLKNTNYEQHPEGNSNHPSRAERMNEPDDRKSQWEILTQRGVVWQSLDQFETDANSPYRRQKWQEKSEVPLLNLPEVETTGRDPDPIIIDDDDDDDMQTSPSSPSLSKGKSRLKQPPQISDSPYQDDKPTARYVGHKQSGLKLDDRDVEVAPTQITPTRKRVREMEEGNEEGESSAHAARRQRLVDEKFARDYLTDEECEALLRSGKLS